MHSHRNFTADEISAVEVLILVVMEDALALLKRALKYGSLTVLILVVMEDALARTRRCKKSRVFSSLNPCCNGRCTRTPAHLQRRNSLPLVLILVVMEDALAPR